MVLLEFAKREGQGRSVAGGVFSAAGQVDWTKFLGRIGRVVASTNRDIARQEHAQPAGTYAGWDRRRQSLQEDCGSACNIEDWFVEAFLTLTPEPTAEIVLDLGADDDRLHGDQLGRFFHGYYKNYCYLPLYIFCGERLFCANLRPSHIDAVAGTVKQVARIIEQIRRACWPDVRIILRGDSGFCRKNLMPWSEDHQVELCLSFYERQMAVAKCRRVPEVLAVDDRLQVGERGRVADVST